MKTYSLLFRMNITVPSAQPSDVEMTQYMHDWSLWLQKIASTNQLAPGGHHFSKEGKVLRKNQISEGPYSGVDQQSVAGFILIYAENITGAMHIAEQCPVLNGDNTSVEIREIQ